MWDQPKRGVGRFTDPALYAETLQLTREAGTITAPLLHASLRRRRRGSLLGLQSLSVALDVIRELAIFGWIAPVEPGTNREADVGYKLTNEGEYVSRLEKEKGEQYHRYLVTCLHKNFIVPGWFVARLWAINPRGQGEIILPEPSSDWYPESSTTEWTADIEAQVRTATRQAWGVNPEAFPVSETDWVEAVMSSWNRLSKPFSPRTGSSSLSEYYRPRRLLFYAMREAAVDLLFNNKPYRQQYSDFAARPPIRSYRTFRVWCARLEALEFIFYTDWHPKVSGRLIFPSTIFRHSTVSSRFVALPDVVDPEGRMLHFHQPAWSEIRGLFWRTLIDTHRDLANKVRSLYVSLLDVRDEVCRQLRLSSSYFEQLLELAMRELPSQMPVSVSLETDVRDEARAGAAMLRRPVHIQQIPYTLIAIAPRLDPDGETQ